MTDRHFVAWVQPIADVLAADRARLIAHATSVDATDWDLPSVVDGWTKKHILAHLSGGNDGLVQEVVRRTIARESLPADLLQVDTDAENARRIAEQVALPVDALIRGLTEDREEMLEMLARLRDEDENYREGGFPMTLGDFLRIVQHERHDALHLEQLRADATTGP
jgi:maleylpyruvate isomerase